MLSQYRLSICTSKLEKTFAPHPVPSGRGIRDECIKELHQKLDQVNAQVLEDSKAGEIMFLPTHWMWEMTGTYFHFFLTRYSRDRVTHQKHCTMMYPGPWKVLQLPGMFRGCSVDVSLFLFHELVFLQEVEPEPCISCQALVSIGGRLGLCEKQGTTHQKKWNPFRIMMHFYAFLHERFGCWQPGVSLTELQQNFQQLQSEQVLHAERLDHGWRMESVC